jgi:hypothetical protein
MRYPFVLLTIRPRAKPSWPKPHRRSQEHGRLPPALIYLIREICSRSGFLDDNRRPLLPHRKERALSFHPERCHPHGNLNGR